MERQHGAALLAFVEGNPLPEPWAQALAWGFVEESRRSSAVCEVGLRDPGCELPRRTGLRPGAGLKLVARNGTGSSELFTGEVTGCEVLAGDSGTHTVIRAHDLSHRLRRGRRVAAYRQRSASDIAAELARKAGLKTGRIDSTSLVYEHLSQAEPDWDFLTRLARQSGHDVFMRSGELHWRAVADAGEAPSPPARSQQSPHVLEYGQNLLKVRVGATLRHQVDTVHVRGWDPDGGKALVAEHRVQRTPSRDVSWRPGDGLGGEPLRLTSLPRIDQNEAEHLAAAMAQEVAASLTELHAVVTGTPQLRLRSAVTLSGLGEDFNGRYTATSVRHEFHPDTGYLTEVTVQEGDGTAAGEVPGDSEASAPRLAGLVCATVSNIQDPRAHGRARVRFPWLSDDYESDWARTLQLGGAQDGGIVCPEVGDEVLVGFEQGCLDRPFILGGLYNQRHAPGKHAVSDLYDTTKGTTNVRSFVSRTGQRLELLDAEGGPLGVLLASGDGKLRLDLDQRGTSISIESDGEVRIDAKRAVHVEADGISLKARKGSLNLSGQQVNVHADTTVSVEGGGTCSLKAPLIKLN
ncbi:VgrG-related protein [Streptomyces sp. NPDC050658]|uniref:VgrG-related protein n=1 Tax=unclassified Streptomyces TaxID=2593676 RepID=UPI00341F06E2